MLPTCTATKLVWSANFREWKHIRKLRLSHKAHPQMQELMGMINEILVAVAPTYFKVTP